MQKAQFGRAVALVTRSLAIIGLTVGALGAADAQQPTVTLVQNVDEPARNPYQQTLAITSACSACDFSFAAVPANTTLRITNVSCYFVMSDTGGIAMIFVNNRPTDYKRAFVQAVAQGNPSFIVANGEINLYSESGNKPGINIETNTGLADFGACTLSGYFVKL